MSFRKILNLSKKEEIEKYKDVIINPLLSLTTGKTPPKNPVENS
jgi:hypothetical protein